MTYPLTAAPSPGAPTRVGPGSIGIGWNPVAGATRYTLQESANGAGWVTLLSDGRTSVGVSRGNGSYAYRVQACNFVNCGAWSGFATVNVALPPPATSQGSNLQGRLH